MNPYRQKPDGLTPTIRMAYKRAGVNFIEPPSGLGCDFILFLHGLVVFLEVKDPAEVNRMTDAEKRLQIICQLAGIPYIIVTDLAAAMAAAGKRLESEA